MEKRPVAGTLIRGADGKLYFIPDAILAPYQITDNQADMIGPVIGDASSLRLPLDPAVLNTHGLSIESEVHGIGESETHGAVSETHGMGAVAETHGHNRDEEVEEDDEDDEDKDDKDNDEGEEIEEKEVEEKEEEGDKDEEEDTGMGDVHRKPAS